MAESKDPSGLRALYRGGQVKRLASKETHLRFQALAWEKEDRAQEDGEESEEMEYDYSAFEDDQDHHSAPRQRKSRQKSFLIRTFGVTEDGQSVSLEIDGFRPYFFLKIPKTWGPSQIRMLSQKLKSELPFYRKNEVVFDKTASIHKDFYGFDDFEDHAFLRISFKTDGARWDMRKALDDEEFNQTDDPTDVRPAMTKELRLMGGARYRFPFYEASVDSVIRFIDVSGIKPTGWIEVERKALRPAKDKTQCELSYSARWEAIQAVDKEEIAPFRVSSYDIECTSCDGSFPQAKRRSDEVIQIGTTTRTFGTKYCQIRHIVCLKKCDPLPNIEHKEEGDELVITESYPTERQVLLAWTKHIQLLDPDVMIGYNIFGFDWKYLYDRAEMLRCLPQFSRLGRMTGSECRLINKQLSSSAMGQNFLHYPDMKGRVQIDLLKVVQREHNLTSYKLDNVAKKFLNLRKNDLPPDQIFKRYKTGSPADIRVIAEYCLQDCVLVNDLFDKLNIFANAVGMSNVCFVPMSLLFLRGQGIKVFSLISKTCRKANHRFPTLKRLAFGADVGVGYEGAIVFDPSPGLYFDPVAVLDYKSLYPSSEIEFNISHEMRVDPTDEKHMNLPGYRYNDITYDIRNDKGEKIGEHTEIFAERLPRTPEEEKNPALCKGIIPRLLIDLLAARSHAKKLKKKAKGTFMESVYDGLQLAYKITCNSVYGYFGAKFSDLRWQLLAASTTAAGRLRLHFAEEEAEKYEGVKVVYGDSVAPRTPLLLRRSDGSTIVRTIDSLVTEWGVTDSSGKYHGSPDEPLEVWTESGWTRVRNVMKHRVQKRMFRVLTHTGLVDVTEDHSLLRDDGKEITPNQVTVGTSLLHSFPSEFPVTKSDLTTDMAFVYGFFFAEGTCGAYPNEKYGTKYSWGLVHQDPSVLYYCQNVLKEDGVETKVLDCMESSRVYKLVPVGKIKPLIEKYRPMFYDEHRNKRIPEDILNAPLEIVQAFWDGYYHGDGDHDENGYTRCDIKGHVGAMGMFFLLRRLGYNVSMNERKDKLNIVRLTATKATQRRSSTKIKKIYELPETWCDEVYDLTTDNHHFHAGVGQMIVHNTDSIFINCSGHPSVKGKEGREALEATIQLGKIIAEAITAQLRYPQELEYEKTFWPFLIITKKRYAGHKYEFDPNKFKFTSMGLVTKRRDNAPIVKVVFQKIIDILFDERNVQKAVAFYQKAVRDLLHGNVPMSDLVVTKTLKATYKNPTQITHKVLAEKIADRDPGNAPASNERIPYVFIDEKELKCKVCNKRVNVKRCKCKTCMYLYCASHLHRRAHECVPRCRMCWKRDKIAECGVCGGSYCNKHRGKHKCSNIQEKAIQGDLVETPSYIEEMGLRIDYRYYLDHQVMKPVQQIFDLIEETQGKNLLKKLLVRDNNRRSGNRTITDFF